MIFAQYRWALWLIAVFGLFSGGVLTGYRYSESTWKLQEATRIAQDERELSQAVVAAQEAGKRHQEAVRSLEAHYVQERSKYEQSIADLQRRVADGRVRVSIPGVCKASAPESTGRADAAGSCELQPGTAEALIDLSKRADEVAMKFTALQEYVRTLGD